MYCSAYSPLCWLHLLNLSSRLPNQIPIMMLFDLDLESTVPASGEGLDMSQPALWNSVVTMSKLEVMFFLPRLSRVY